MKKLVAFSILPLTLSACYNEPTVIPKAKADSHTAFAPVINLPKGGGKAKRSFLIKNNPKDKAVIDRFDLMSKDDLVIVFRRRDDDPNTPQNEEQPAEVTLYGIKEPGSMTDFKIDSLEPGRSRGTKELEIKSIWVTKGSHCYSYQDGSGNTVWYPFPGCPH